MLLSDYEPLVSSENAARRYLLGFVWKNHQRYCPRCRHRGLYLLAEGRRRCGRCRYTFHDFSGRYLNRGQLSCQQWLRLLKLFEVEATPAVMAGQTGLAEATVAKALTTLRAAIVAGGLDAPACVAAGWHAPWEAPGGASGEASGDSTGGASGDAPGAAQGGAPAGLEPPVFGIVEHGNLVFVDLMPDLRVEDILRFKTNFHLKTRSAGGMVYTDKYRHHVALAACAPVLTEGYLRHADRGLAMDKTSAFWRFAKPRILRRQGMTPMGFPLHLKELEFRFNYRQQDIFPLLAARLCALVPHREEAAS